MPGEGQRARVIHKCVHEPLSLVHTHTHPTRTLLPSPAPQRFQTESEPISSPSPAPTEDLQSVTCPRHALLLSAAGRGAVLPRPEGEGPRESRGSEAQWQQQAPVQPWREPKPRPFPRRSALLSCSGLAASSGAAFLAAALCAAGWLHHPHLQMGKLRPESLGTGLKSQSWEVAEAGLAPRQSW